LEGKDSKLFQQSLLGRKNFAEGWSRRILVGIASTDVRFQQSQGCNAKMGNWDFYRVGGEMYLR
jgi:hypothetical protein